VKIFDVDVPEHVEGDPPVGAKKISGEKKSNRNSYEE